MMSDELYTKLTFIPVIVIIVSIFIIGINLVNNYESGFEQIKTKFSDSDIKSENTETTEPFFNNKLFDLNKISYEKLKEIPGITDGIAKNIVEYRDSASGFKHLNERLLINGITEEKFRLLFKYLYVAE